MKLRVKGRKKEAAEDQAQTRGADFTVLMLGQRRTGKSSVLSSMITSMEKICADTGFRFTADDDTKIFMRTKLSQLQRIFLAHQGEAEFTTMEGEQNGVEYGAATDADTPYRFILEQVNGKKNKKSRTFVIEFVDIRGESMTEDFSAGKGPSVNERIMKSGVLLIAIDAPALMEGRLKEGVGEYHSRVNLPEDIYSHITAADAEMRRNLKAKERMEPRLVLFVPLKCEKYYYYEHRMEELNARIRTGYQDLFAFFQAHNEYTVAITPILTLGDVVFDHYKSRTVKLPNGMEREVAVTFGDSGLESMRTVPKYPMFRFRTAEPKFSPRYCEQPLLYLLAYVDAVSGLAEKKSGGKMKSAMFWAGVLLIASGGLSIWGTAGTMMLLEALQSDPELKKALRAVVERMKTSEDGYELVYDNLGLGKGKKL